MLVLTTLEQNGLFLISKQNFLIATCPLPFCCAQLERVWLPLLSDHSPSWVIPASPPPPKFCSQPQPATAALCSVLYIVERSLIHFWSKIQGITQHSKTCNPTEKNKRSVLISIPALGRVIGWGQKRDGRERRGRLVTTAVIAGRVFFPR